jgi:hypothetical protein
MKGVYIMDNKKIDAEKAKKTAGNNQWTSAGEKPVHPDRRDGPGGEEGK